jgi:hypothetical protein
VLKLYRNLLIKSITALVGLCNISEGDFAANSAYLCKHKVAKTAKLWFQYHKLNIVVKMVGLPRLELGTCGAKELSRMLAFANRQVLN